MDEAWHELPRNVRLLVDAYRVRYLWLQPTGDDPGPRWDKR